MTLVNFDAFSSNRVVLNNLMRILEYQYQVFLIDTKARVMKLLVVTPVFLLVSTDAFLFGNVGCGCSPQPTSCDGYVTPKPYYRVPPKPYYPEPPKPYYPEPPRPYYPEPPKPYYPEPPKPYYPEPPKPYYPEPAKPYYREPPRPYYTPAPYYVSSSGKFVASKKCKRLHFS
uniref:Extensin-like n=1 Tax=Angiostrongylus cantonensis TaxID=6313 RepID=A0A0K0CW71_ANGCA